MYIGKISVTLKSSVLDPQGTTVHRALDDMGEKNIKDVRIGKYIEIKIDGNSEEDALVDLNRICKSLLVNEVIETYYIQLEKCNEL
jgi:phosphoribosylformylglycinamidine synthase